MTSSVRTFKKVGIEIQEGCLVISTDNINFFNKHYNVIVYHDTINNMLRVTGDRPKTMFYTRWDTHIPIDLVSDNSIEEYKPFFSKRKKKRIRSGYIELIETEKFEFTTNNFIIIEKK